MNFKLHAFFKWDCWCIKGSMYNKLNELSWLNLSVIFEIMRIYIFIDVTEDMVFRCG